MIFFFTLILFAGSFLHEKMMHTLQVTESSSFKRKYLKCSLINSFSLCTCILSFCNFTSVFQNNFHSSFSWFFYFPRLSHCFCIWLTSGNQTNCVSRCLKWKERVAPLTQTIDSKVSIRLKWNSMVSLD